MGVYEPFTSIVTRRYKNPYRMPGGVPMVDYPDGGRRNPVTTAQLGLIKWSQWKRFRTPGALDIAMKQAEWLVRNQDRRGAWRFGFSYQAPGTTLTLKKGWASALAQGQAMSLLVRAYSRTGEARYLEAARRAFRFLRRPVRSGGLVRELDGAGVWFEEYPTSPPSYILNGNMFTIVGVWDLSQFDQSARDVVRQAAATVEQALPQFDDGAGAAWYDLTYRYGYPKHAAAPVYPPFVEDTLRVLAQITGRKAFITWANRWRAAPRPQDG
jgi:heparosan-N-sulfate-glucuronate 5-epimerase